MLNLSSIIILSVNSSNPLMAALALKYSCKDIQFKEVLLFTHEDIQSQEWSESGQGGKA